MRVLKFPSVVCAALVCAGSLSVRAQDNPAQAAARAALAEMMNGTNAPAMQTNAAPVAVEPPPAVPQMTNTPTPPMQMKMPVPAPVMTPPPLDSDAQAKARAALLQQMGQPPEDAPPVPPPAMKPMAAPPVAQMPAPPMMPPPVIVPPPPKPVAMMPSPPAATPNQFGNEPGFAPIVAPPLPISAAKQQQLAALLAQYQADQISPEQYHTQRAAILAAP
jgi:hypothetical protein